MRKWLTLSAIAAVALGGVAFAQTTYYPGANVLSSLSGSFAVPIINAGPQSAVLPLNGGTFTCASGTATVANAAVDAGSIITMTPKTVGGTVAALFIATITPGTGFTVTCGGSDTTVYNYVIMS